MTPLTTSPVLLGCPLPAPADTPPDRLPDISPRVAFVELPADAEALAALPGQVTRAAGTGRRMHLLFGADVPAAAAVEAAAAAAGIVPAGTLLMSSPHPEVVAALRGWADTDAPGAGVGLRVGDPSDGRPRWRDFYCDRTVRSSRANLLVTGPAVATWRLCDMAVWTRLPLLVRGVDSPAALARFTADNRVWAVSTAHPRQAPADAVPVTPAVRRFVVGGMMLLFAAALALLTVVLTALVTAWA